MKKEFKKITSNQFQELLLSDNSNNDHFDIELKNYEIEWDIYINNDKKIFIDNCYFNWWLFLASCDSVYLRGIKCPRLSISWEIKSFALSSSEIWFWLILSGAKIDFFNVFSLWKEDISYITKIIFWWAQILRWYFYNTVIRDFEINSGQIDDLSFDGNNFIGKYTLRWNHSLSSICHNWLVFSSLNLERFVWWSGISFINCENDNQPGFEAWRKKFELEKQEEYLANNPYLDQENKTLRTIVEVIDETGIHIKNSNLDKTQFHNCDLKKSDISIENSNLTEIITTNFELPEKISSNHLKWRRENYRQLKYNFSKQWDSFNALRYHDKEMEALSEFSISNIGIWNYIVLTLSNLISNNGTNWLLVLFWIILFNFISFVLFLHLSSFPCVLVNIPEFLLSNLKYTYFLSDIDSLKPLLWISSLSFSTNSELVFYATKIFNAVLIYHLIISFRKFNKEF